MAVKPSSKQIQKAEKRSKAARSIEHEHAKIHDSNAYSFSVQSTLTNAGSYTLLLSNPSSYFPHYRTVRIRPTVGPVRFSVYEAPVINVASLGTEVTPLNMDRMSTNTSSLAVFVNPVTNVASLGTKLEDEIIPVAGIQGGGNSNINVFEWILAEGTDYIIVFENQTTAGQLSYTSFFYEV